MSADPIQWTVMVYMAGDNNLSTDMAYALRDIRESARVQNRKVNLMVYYDGSGLDTPTYYCDFSDFANPHYEPAYTVEKRYTYKDPDVAAMANAKDENAATMYSILNFVDWCVNPAKRGKATDKYALIFSGHGFGFQSASFLSDETSDYYMTIKKLRITLQKIHKEIIKKPIALVGFDACVMGMLEIAHEIKDHAGVMIASEGTIPNAGWTYSNILGDLVSDQDHSDAKDVACRFVRQFIDSQKEFSVGGVSVDMSAWDLEKTESVVDALDSLGEIFLFGLLKDSKLYRPLRNALIQSHWESQSYMYEQNVDLKDFCERLLDAVSALESDEKFVVETEGEDVERKFLDVLRERCRAVCSAVDSAVLASGFSGGVYQYSNGISVFFPWTLQTYLFSEKAYTALQFAKKEGSNWNAFLVHFLREVTLRGQNSTFGRVNPMFGQPETEVAISSAAAGVGVIGTTETATKIIQNPANRIIEAVINTITENPAHRIIQNPANRVPENPATRVPENPATRVPENPATRVPENPATRVPENPATRVPENPATRVPENSATRVPENPATRVPENPATRVPENPAMRVPENPAMRVPENPAMRVPENPATRVPENPAVRVPENPATRLYTYPADRIIENAANRILSNPASRMIQGSANRIPENPANRLINGSNGVISSFKNVATPWDIFGYSKEEGTPDVDEEKVSAASPGTT